MAKQTRKPSPRLSVPPPGTLAFADGGKVDPDELMRQMTAKYGAPAAGPAQQQAVQQPAPQPQPKAQARPEQQGITTGIVGILKGRQQQIDKAAGFANGGKISGPGTAKSDSISATIRETGEGIRVSNKERIVSAEQDQFLEGVAQAAGYESLDAMLEDGTGKPVGPVVKGGKRAAATGMAPETDPDTDGRRQYSPASGEAFANRGGTGNVAAAIAAPPTLGGAPLARSEPARVLTGPAAGITIDPFGPKPQKLGSGVTDLDLSLSSGQQPTKPGRDASGIITADSAQAAMGSDMQRSAGVFGTIDMKGVNDIMARENKARGEMIDLSIAANGGNGVAILGDGGVEAANAEKANRWALDDLRGEIMRAGTRTERAALGHALNQSIAGQNQQATEAIRQEGIARGQDLGYGAKMAQQGLTARGQELGLQRAQERNEVIARGQDLRAGTAADRTASNEAIAAARITERSAPSLGQQRGNAEIDAARASISGLTPDEIKRKTANFTATGRENPEYDPTLAKAVTLANRRKVGADDDFDQRQQPQQPAGANEHGYDRADVAQRFRSERAMDRHKLGNDTPNGVEVLDASGKVIGHYR